MMTERKNIDPWIATKSGNPFYFDDRLESSIVSLVDIAWGLANKCRYSGQTGEKYYSVAEHSVLTAYLVVEMGYPEFAMEALLHDAAEAYMADIPSPLKQYFPEWNVMEDRILRHVFNKYNLDFPLPNAVKKADYAMLAKERQHLFPKGPAWSGVPEIDEKMSKAIGPIHCLSPKKAYEDFMNTFCQLDNLLNKKV